MGYQASVALIGPRQVGKTTLALDIGEERGALYLDLEDRTDREKLAEPSLFLERYADRLVILDEPFAGVDPISVSDIKVEIRDLSARGIGVLITDHNVRDTLDICHRAYIVHEGHIIAEGNAAAILANETVRQVYLGDGFSI